jgi:hypothetical protein
LPNVEIATSSAGKIGACLGAGEAIGRLVSLLAPGSTAQAIHIFRKHEPQIDFGAIGRVRNDQDAIRGGQFCF